MERSRGSKRVKWAGAVTLILLALVLAFGLNLSNFVRGVFASIVSKHDAQSIYAGLSKDALIARLTADDQELSRIRYQGLLYSLLADENAALRKTAFAAPLQSGVTGRVIARPPHTAYDTLLIDVGSDTGVHQNDLAVFQGILLGRAVSVGKNSSTVALFSSPGTLNDVIIGTPSAVAVAHGLGGGAFELSVPQGVKVMPGDIVRFPATESLALGVVVSVSAEAQDVSQTVRFTSPVSFADLDFIHMVSQ